MTTPTYRIDLDRMTVTHTDSDGEKHDLNASGEPIGTLDELRSFVRELRRQGAFSAATETALLAEVSGGAVGNYPRLRRNVLDAMAEGPRAAWTVAHVVEALDDRDRLPGTDPVRAVDQTLSALLAEGILDLDPKRAPAHFRFERSCYGRLALLAARARLGEETYALERAAIEVARELGRGPDGWVGTQEYALNAWPLP